MISRLFLNIRGAGTIDVDTFTNPPNRDGDGSEIPMITFTAADPGWESREPVEYEDHQALENQNVHTS